MQSRATIMAAAVCAAALLFGECAVAQVKRAKGWVRESAHIKATIPLMLRFQDYLPEEVDLASKFPTPGDQGQQSSCTAWATGYAMRSYYEGQRRRWNFSSPVQVISPAYIYNKLHDFRGNCDTGTAISEALGVLKSVGAPTLSAYPYNENDCSRPASAQLVRDSSAFRISGWNALDNKRLDDAKGQLAQGNPVVFGMEVSEKFENLQGNEIYDDVASPRTGGHAMVLVGYSERRQAFKVMNSWGTDWGSGGFGWISYRAVRQLSDLMFTMDVPSVAPPLPAPAPTPSPAPVPPPVVIAPPPVVAPPEPPVVTPPVVKPQPTPPVVTPPVVKPQPSPPVVTPPPPVVVAPPPPQPSPPPAPPKPVVTPPSPPVVVAPPPPQPAPPKPVVTPPVVVPPVASVQKEIAARARELRCARIDAKIGTNRVAQLRGFAGYANELAKLQTDLAALPGVKRVDSKVALYPWPQCEVFLNFADPLKTPRGMSAKLRGATARNFAGGDSLSIDVVTPAYPSYLYVTYLQASGDAANLYWPEGKFPKALPPHTKLTFGGGQNGEPVYRIAPPFGDEIVVIVASASPLFQDELPDTATSRDYLTSFRKSFLLRPKSGGGERAVSVVAVPIKTQSRQ